MNSDFGKDDKGEDCVYHSILSKRIPEIDGLRGFAIIGVLAFHLFGEAINYEQSHWLINFLAEKSKSGSSGVALFFVISGFLIGGILLDNKDSPNYFKTFYLRRFFRIFPLYYFVIFSIYGLIFLTVHKIIEIPDWIIGFTFSGKWYLAFAQNFPMARDGNLGASALQPTWSLAVEEQFYLTLPFIVWSVPRKFLTILVTGLICFAPVCRALIWSQTSNPIATNMLMPGCLDVLMTGVFIAILLRSDKPARFIKKYRLKVLIPAFVLLYIIWTMINGFVSSKFSVLGNNPHVFTNTFCSLFFGMLLISAVTSKPGDIISIILRNRLLRKIGELSYCIYLIHIAVFCFVYWQMNIVGKPPFGSVWLTEISLTLTITFILATLSWKYFEKPLINYGHRFRYKI